ncbi:N-acetylneuraminate synthase family protein [Motiliproteus sp.]|uniref:N-acetylneuraminate synthase family protein n=1 Tax=Motiliproteus sp. TaxID=1898955 RepID=UPI003BAB163F
MIKQDSCYIVAEIGINHNGDLDIAKQLIELAKDVGCDAVKFQKRTVDVVYTAEELERYRESPFGTTNGALKYGLELSLEQYQEIDRYCKELQIDWFGSPWDEQSVDFLMEFDTPYIKVASASATDKGLLEYCSRTGRPLLVSTGMCDLAMIKKIVSTIDNAGGEIAMLYHCTSTYPSEMHELNLSGIQTLKQAFPGIPIGYSGHEPGVTPSVIAVALGAESVERHITLKRTMWGSDHAASLEPQGLRRLVRDIRDFKVAQGDGIIELLDTERPIAEKLRRKSTI